MLNLADVVFRVGRAYGMTADRGSYQAVAVKDGGRPVHDPDGLLGQVGIDVRSPAAWRQPGQDG